MTTVRELLQAKGGEVWSIAPEASVFDAIKLMADKGIGVLLVLDEGKLVGIISERDYARKVILQGRYSKDTRVDEIMTRQVIAVQPEQGVEECMLLMTTKRIRHLPVLTGEQLVGIISIGDLVKSIISEQEFIIAQLENYIMSPPTPSIQPSEPPGKTPTATSLIEGY